MFARQHAVSQPEKAAIIMGTSGDSVTYAVYEGRCDQAAQFLRAAGLRRGDHIAVFMENSIRMLEIEGAAERAVLHADQHLPRAGRGGLYRDQLKVTDAYQLGRPAAGGRGRCSQLPAPRATADDRP